MREDYEPFDNAEEVWFWFCQSLEARGDGLRSRCDYSGKIRCLETPGASYQDTSFNFKALQIWADFAGPIP